MEWVLLLTYSSKDSGELHNGEGSEACHRGVCADNVQSQFAILCARTPNPTFCPQTGVYVLLMYQIYFAQSDEHTSKLNIFAWLICNFMRRYVLCTVRCVLLICIAMHVLSTVFCMASLHVHPTQDFVQSQFAILCPRTPHSLPLCTLCLPSPLPSILLSLLLQGHCTKLQSGG